MPMHLMRHVFSQACDSQDFLMGHMQDPVKCDSSNFESNNILVAGLSLQLAVYVLWACNWQNKSEPH